MNFERSLNMEIENLRNLKVSSVANVYLIDPNTIEMVDPDTGEVSYAVLNLESRNIIYSALGIKYNTSKDTFSASVDIWKDLIGTKMSNNGYQEDIIKATYVLDGDHNCVTIVPFSVAPKDSVISAYKSFCDFISGNLHVAYTSNCMRIIKKTDIDTGFAAALEVDMDKSIYKMYTVAYEDNDLEKLQPLSSEPDVFSRNFYEYVSSNLDYEFQLSTKIAKSSKGHLYFQSAFDHMKDIELSLREVLHVFSMCKIKFSVDDADNIVAVAGLDTSWDYISQIINYLSSFNIPLSSLKKLSETRKSLKYNKYNCMDMMKFLRYYYINTHMNMNVTMDSIIYVCKCANNASDMRCIKEELNVDI